MPVCPSCKGEVAAGSRWCSICRSNIVNQSVGRLATPGKRLGAFFLDIVVPGVAVFLIFAAIGAGMATGSAGAGSLGVLVGLGLLLAYVVWAFMLFTKGMTPGKRLLGIHVVSEDGSNAGFFTMLIREWIGKAISGMILSLGYLWILIDRDKQGWHDKLVSTYVVE